MTSMLITPEDFERMRKEMDKDGDGQVSKEEFKKAYKSVYTGELASFEAAYELVWTKIDANGDGNLTVDELAAFYGFNLKDGGSTAEMSDDQILQALALSAELDSKKAGDTAKPEKPVPKMAAKDATIRTLNLDKSIMVGDKTIPGDKAGATFSPETIEHMCNLMSCCMVGDLKSDSEKDDTVMKFLETDKVIVRIEDEKGEMPLHKLSRLEYKTFSDAKKMAFKQVFNTLLVKMRREANAVGRALVYDVNHQAKDGKTPIFSAIEKENIEMIEMLNDLNKDGPDSMMVTSAGWSMLHQAVHTDNIEVVKAVIKSLSPGRLRVLIRLEDKTGREPLHIAAYKCVDSNIVQLLMDHGASNEKKDNAGNVPSNLARKAERRASREIIESNEVKGNGGRGRRASREIEELLDVERTRRNSKELVAPPVAAPAAA